MNETFVFGEVEVKKTGRWATKDLPNNKKLTLVEVTPVNTWDGSWKKWANPSSLLIVEGVDSTADK
mgnify:CR=1 FL=1